ncbi:MAG: hypothetical protein ACP5JG_00705 [Anaerolineae bacterium]
MVVLFGLAHLGLLIINAERVPPTHGYDWPGHLTYLYHVAEYWRVPPEAVSAQFFNTPLYYFGVAVFQRLTGLPLLYAGPIFNIGLAVLTFVLWAWLSYRLWEGSLAALVWSLGLYVCQPTVYRAFGMVRPEALLLPFFVTAGWLVVWATARRPHWIVLGVFCGVLSGLAFGTRQWGAFLAAALGLWLVLRTQASMHAALERWGSAIAHSIAFAAVSGLFLFLRGGGPLAFNYDPHLPKLEFWTRLALPTLFSTPVRPALNGRFWALLYADFWGDYWRYWREALIHASLPSSPSTVAALTRSMWAAIPVTLMIVLGWWLHPVDSEERRAFHRWTRLLSLIALGGYALFAGLYADPAKGDTVKGIYVVYLVPYLAWLGALAAQRWRSAGFGAGWLVWLPLLLVAVFVAPLTLYRPPSQMQSSPQEMLSADHSVGVTFGDAITLVGYQEVVWDADGRVLEITWVWRADGYTGRGYKVFVHLVSPEGQLLAQSDAVPAQWRRPTYAWRVGEYITDTHRLSLEEEKLLPGSNLRVGLYDKLDGRRLSTGSGADYVRIELDPESMGAISGSGRCTTLVCGGHGGMLARARVSLSDRQTPAPYPLLYGPSYYDAESSDVGAR